KVRRSCGTGQNSRTLTAYFEMVVGIDVSESQVEQARAVLGFPNLIGTAEELPFPDGTVDLLMAVSVAHWFDTECFIKEATHNMKIHYESCGDRLNNIYEEVTISNYNYTSSKITGANNKLKILFETIPFPDKKRIEIIPLKQQLSTKNVIGFIQTFSMYQAYLRADLSAATVGENNITEMKVSSTEAKVDFIMKYFCVLACKPE
uniref:Zgc:162396 n=1 Tax=Sinocyclocheilus grahami TaxID=75366 RepID=A0A672TDW8_SINGR